MQLERIRNLNLHLQSWMKDDLEKEVRDSAVYTSLGLVLMAQIQIHILIEVCKKRSRHLKVNIVENAYSKWEKMVYLSVWSLGSLDSLDAS